MKWIFINLVVMFFCACTSSPDGSDANTEVEPASIELIKNGSVIFPETDSVSLSELFINHHKLLVNNKLTFDVLSLGAPMNGSYLILKSDQSRASYTAITGERQGYITNSSATDLDADDQIEVLIYVKRSKNDQGSVIIHEIDSLNNHTQVSLPELTTDLSDGYDGRDSFYVANGKIIREFPIFKENKAIGKIRHIEYVLKNNTLLSSGHLDKNL